MNKDLAKKLHESGFPNLEIYQHDFIEEPLSEEGRPGWDIQATCKLCGEIRKYASGGIRTSSFNDGCPVVGDYTMPTLSELIEACGDRFWNLNYEPDGTWAATGFQGWIGTGSTPEIAVANLWLALNKK